MWLQILTAFCFLFLLHVWHRRKFFYLSWKVNGPFGWPIMCQALRFSDSTKVFKRMSEIIKQYKSPISFWAFGNLMMFYTEPQDFETILTSPHSLDKGPLYKIGEFVVGGEGLITMDGEAWKPIRKLLNPTLQNYNILNSFYPKFNKNMRLMTELLEKKVGKGIFDIYRNLEACTLDIICDTTFGVTMNIQKGENLMFMECTNNLTLLAGIQIFQPWYRLYPVYRLSKYYKIIEASKRGTQEFVKQILDKKIEEYKSKKVNCEIKDKSNEVDEFDETRYNIFIDEIVRLSVERNCFTEYEMLIQSLTMMIGGFETSALTVAYIVLMLALHPEGQERVFQEIREIFPEQQSDVTSGDMSKMKYTDQFIKETMRVTPTVPFLARYVKKDFQIGKHTIPEGTQLICSIFHLHRNKAVWGDTADTFNPDRFHPDVYKQHPYSFIPFSAGARNCIAMKYGHIVIRLFVAWIVRNYRFTTDLKMDELSFTMNITLKLLQGHMVYIHKRENY